MNIISRITEDSVNCAKRFSLGVASGLILAPLCSGISFAAQACGYLPTITREDGIREGIAKTQEYLKNNNPYNITYDVEKLISAKCYYEEYARQYNSYIPKSFSNGQITAWSIQKDIIRQNVIAPPLIEEILFRGLIQDVLLTRIPKYMIKIVAPGKESLLDSTVAKAARICLTAALFSSLHFRNQQLRPEAEVVSQVVCTFALGLGLGMIKESKAGILGAIGAHMANNALVSVPIYLDC